VKLLGKEVRRSKCGEVIDQTAWRIFNILHSMDALKKVWPNSSSTGKLAEEYILLCRRYFRL